MTSGEGKEMKMQKHADIVSELQSFLDQLLAYFDYRKRLRAGKQLGKDEWDNMGDLFGDIGRKAGRFGPLITELTGLEKVTVGERERDMWLVGLRIEENSIVAGALQTCVHATNRAIGRLEEDIKNGIRDEHGNPIEKLQSIDTEPPKAFISHGKKSVALTKLEEFLQALGVEPLIVKEKPSLDKTVDDKVNYYLDQADCVIILATGDDKIEDKLYPRQNVVHEIGLAQKPHKGKIIYLLEEGAEFPSNIRPKTYERFKQRNMQDAFFYTAKELRAFGILKAVKP